MSSLLFYILLLILELNPAVDLFSFVPLAVLELKLKLCLRGSSVLSKRDLKNKEIKQQKWPRLTK